MEPGEFREIYHRYSPLAWSMIARAGVPERDREDVFMEAWEAVFSSLGTFAGRSGLATWIARIVHHKAVDRVRRAVPLPLADSDLVPRAEREGFVPGPGRESIRREAAELIRDFLETLPSRRRLVARGWLEGLSYREIAARAGRPGDTGYVGKEIHRVKARLAGRLSAAGIDSLEDIWE